MTRAAFAAALCAIALGASPAHANAKPLASSSAAPAAASTVVLSAAASFGAESAEGDGWMGVVVYVENVGAVAAKGTVEISSTVAGGRHGDDNVFVAKAPFNVPVGRRAAVHLPTHGLVGYMPSVVVRARADDGRPLAEVPMTSGAAGQPLLVDIEPTPKIATQLRGWTVPLTWNPRAMSYYSPPATTFGLLVGSPPFDRTTGDPVLPERAAEYAPATVVLVRSDVLAKLEGLPLEALVDWIIAGGSIAVVPTRPEDLRSGPLPLLVGGEITRVDAPAALLTYPAPPKPPAGGPSPFDPSDPFDTTPAPTPSGATPISFIPVKGSTTRPGTTKLGPSAAVREKLTGFAGGNLRTSPYGASARYGLGEVHLLAFNPQEEPALGDAWAHGRMIDLVAKTWDRHAELAFPHGGGEHPQSSLVDVRRALDPNENFRVALGLSAVLLVAYSILAGPVTFLRAMRRGKPLDPLVWAPLWSAVTFGIILLVGTAGKGWSGRARRVSLVEAGAGMQRGVIRRYRGFFSSQTKSLAIRGTDRTCVLDVAAADSREHGDAVLRLDGRGSVLENLTALPWQTVVVKEDGVFEMQGGVSILPASDGSVDVVNHTGRELKDALVWVPKQGLYWFGSIANGATVHASTGKLLHNPTTRAKTTIGTRVVHTIDPWSLEHAIGGKDGERVHQTWQPIFGAAANVDWEPDDAASLLAELTGGEGAKGDSGLAVESDRLFVHVVGEGGAH